MTRDSIFYTERLRRDLNNRTDSSVVKQAIPGICISGSRFYPSLPSNSVELANSESVRVDVFDINFSANLRDGETLAIMRGTVKVGCPL